MEYKVNILGVPNVNLFTDESSAKKLVTSVSGVQAAKKLAATAKFSDKLIKVEKVLAKKNAKKTVKKPLKKVGKRKK
jgi:hypothetical protein